MAEAVVEERAPVLSRFFCHMCNVEINIPNRDFICPICSDGFVEELPAAPSSTSTNSGNSASGEHGVSSSAGNDGPTFSRMSDLDPIAAFLMSRNGPNVEISIDHGRRGNLVTLGGGGGSSSGSSGSTGGGRVRSQDLGRMDHVLMDFLQSLSGGDIDFPPGNAPMFFMGNPGDYAWGREGIDTIVTQLLNQMETAGPPPLAKEEIDKIPKVEVTQEDVDRKTQCSVCWEDFRLDEIVRKLRCSHIYHENCIVPWLNLHGTCPICRKSLIDEEANAVVLDMESSSSSSRNNTQYSHHRNSAIANAITESILGNGSRVSANTSQSSTAAVPDGRTSQTQNQRSNTFAFDDGNVDLD